MSIKKREDVKIGQVWRRANGNLVKLGSERQSRGSRELELIPLGSGRKSWKWDGGIINDLEFVKDCE